MAASLFWTSCYYYGYQSSAGLRCSWIWLPGVGMRLVVCSVDYAGLLAKRNGHVAPACRLLTCWFLAGQHCPHDGRKTPVTAEGIADEGEDRGELGCCVLACCSSVLIATPERLHRMTGHWRLMTVWVSGEYRLVVELADGFRCRLGQETEVVFARLVKVLRSQSSSPACCSSETCRGHWNRQANELGLHLISW